MVEEAMTEAVRTALRKSNNKREDELKKILLKGIDDKIRQELWPRLDPQSTFDNILRAALLAQSVILKKGQGQTGYDLIAVITIKENEHKQQLEKTERLRSIKTTDVPLNRKDR